MSKRFLVSVLSSVVAIVVGLVLVSPAQAANDKVGVCHVDDEGAYHLISVSAKAVPAHLAHGDGLVGGDVPGREGFVFGEDCSLDGPPADPIAAGCYASTNGFSDLQYVGPADTAGNVLAWPSTDGSCSSFDGNPIEDADAIVSAADATEAAQKCAAAGLTLNFLQIPMNHPVFGYAGLTSTTWYCNAP